MSAPVRLELLTDVELSEWLTIPLGTLADWRLKRINIPFIRVSDRVIRYDRAEVEKYLKSQTVAVKEKTRLQPGFKTKEIGKNLV